MAQEIAPAFYGCAEVASARVSISMAPLLNPRVSALYGWALLIVASLLLFWLGCGTPIYRFATGFMVSVFVLVIALALFECVWQAVAYALRALGLARR